MSIESWKAEFYPVDADTAAHVGASQLELIRHSLRKWRGLQPDELQKHGVRACGNNRRIAADPSDLEKDSFRASGETCALCAYHHRRSFSTCVPCPLSIARGGVPCDEGQGTPSEMTSPWDVWITAGDPAPMIMWLTKAEEAHRHQEMPWLTSPCDSGTMASR